MQDKLWIQTILIFIILSLDYSTVYAHEHQRIKFGTQIKKSDIEHYRQQLGPNFSAEQALILPWNEQLIVLYDGKHWKGYLSVFEQGHEQVLWESDFPFFTLLPGPALAAGLFTRNETLDILVCHSFGAGMGKASEQWETNMLLFSEGEQAPREPLELAFIDSVLADAGEGEGGYLRRARVMIFPASKDAPCTFYVPEEHYDQIVGHYEKVSSWIEKYRMRNHKIQWIESFEEGDVNMAELLRSIVWAKRSEGVEPIFFFSGEMYADWVNESEWFDF